MAARVTAGWILVVIAATVSGAYGQERTPVGRGGEALIERTLAIVGGAVVTQSDVGLARALGLVEGGLAATPEAALTALVDRWLMLQEVARFAPAEPDAAAVEARVAEIRARVGDATIARLVAESGRGPSFLAAWVRDDLRVASYLAQRFASADVPRESDVAAYMEAQAAEFARLGVSAADAAAMARTRLVQERRRVLIADWLADLRRRAGVATFSPGM